MASGEGLKRTGSATIERFEAAAEEAFLSPCRWSEPPHPDLAEAGYAVEEFLVSGRGRIFRDGEMRPPAVAGEDDYRTRALVIAPRRDEAFSGVLHVELLNPSSGFDAPIYWPDTAPHLMRRGDAFLGFTCKRIAVEALQGADGERYGTLSFPHDGLVWDVIGDILAACHDEAAGGMLPGLRRPERILLTGWSQTGSFIRTYLSEGLHRLHSEEFGTEICDGYLIGVSSGGFGPYGYINVDRDGEVEFDDLLRPLEPLAMVPMDDPRRVVRGSAVPVIELMSEEEAISHLWHTRADSDTAGDLYRCYQIPARGHGSGLIDEAIREADHRQVGYKLEDEPFAAPPRHAASAYLMAAVVDALVAWTDGTSPPRVDPIALEVDAEFVRDPEGISYDGVRRIVDDVGHVRGGFRYLDVEVPVRLMRPAPGGPLAMNEWQHETFDTAELKRRYGSPRELREHAREVAAELVAARLYPAADSARAVEELMCGIPAEW